MWDDLQQDITDVRDELKSTAKMIRPPTRAAMARVSIFALFSKYEN